MRLTTIFRSLKYIVLCGIAGAAPSADDPDRNIHLGDLVIANRDGILQYDFGHVRRDAGVQSQTLRRGTSAPAGVFLDISNNLAAMNLRGERPWLTRLQERLPSLIAVESRYARPVDGPGVFSYERVSGTTVDTVERKPDYNDPKLFHGAIGSANCVLKDPIRRDQLRDGEPRILAIEMEASGVADACAASGLHFTVVRGICDYCDRHKKDHWQFYAAAAAAALAYCVIQQLPSELPGIRTDLTGPRPETTELVRIGQQAVLEGARSASAGVGASDYASPARRPTMPEQSLPLDHVSDSATTGEGAALDMVRETGLPEELARHLANIELEIGRRNWDSMMRAARNAESILAAPGPHIDPGARARALADVARAYITWMPHVPESDQLALREHAAALIQSIRELS